jgi:hypothetical protein
MFKFTNLLYLDAIALHVCNAKLRLGVVLSGPTYTRPPRMALMDLNLVR